MPVHTKIKGKLTFRITAVLFIFSAVFELFTITGAVFLFGSVRAGPVALIYHVLYTALYFTLAMGLWGAKPWGARLVFIATVFYTLDKAQFIVYRKAVLTTLAAKTGPFRDILSMVDTNLLLQVLTVATLFIVACWWGFAFYTYLRRDYFAIEKEYDRSGYK